MGTGTSEAVYVLIGALSVGMLVFAIVAIWQKYGGCDMGVHEWGEWGDRFGAPSSVDANWCQVRTCTRCKAQSSRFFY